MAQGCRSSLEHEIYGADQAEACPEIVKADRFLHVEVSEWNEYRQGDYFLEDFQLGQGEGRIADTVCRYLDQVFHQGDPPAGDGGHIPGIIIQIF